jgi:hypothetical protein
MLRAARRRGASSASAPEALQRDQAFAVACAASEGGKHETVATSRQLSAGTDTIVVLIGRRNQSLAAWFAKTGRCGGER